MQGSPVPRLDDPPASEEAVADDGWALLEGLRRRLDDQASLTRKTQQQVGQLTDSLAALVSEQRRRTRRINLNSFVAYLIFTLLCLTGFYVLYNSRAGELVEARDHAVTERDAAVKQADELATKNHAHELAETKAWEIYQLLEAGQPTEASRRLSAARGLSRTERALLETRAREAQITAVDHAIKTAAAAFKAGHYHVVIAPLERALATESRGSRAAMMRYYLGVAYAKAGTYDKAISYLRAAVAADVDEDEARFQLAAALDRSGAYAKARVEYEKYASKSPQSPRALYSMRRAALLARMPPVAPVKPAAPAAIAKPAVAPPAAKATGPTPAATTLAKPTVKPPAAAPAKPVSAKPAPAKPAPAKPAPPATTPAAATTP